MRLKLSSHLEGAKEDLEYEKKEIWAASILALGEVGEDMKIALQEHIQKDWHDAWGDPLVYERRTDNPSLGTPLGSEKNMSYSVSKTGLHFRYFPSQQHKNREWSVTNGDSLIRMLQENLGWKWKPSEDTQGRMIMPRPFWDNFVEEEETRALSVFITEMKKVDNELDIKQELNERIDLSEYKLSE